MARPSKLDVTILGPGSSGKTTFLMGMYAVMSGGAHPDWTLHCRDRQLGMDLLQHWDLFAEKGKLPDPNPAEKTFRYPFVFKAGLDPWLEFDVVDYRGGLVSDPSAASDTDKVMSHLTGSASVYVVVSSEHLTLPVSSQNVDQVLRKTKLRYIGALLQSAIEACQSAGRPLPSVVMLLTKSDHLRPRFENRPHEVVVKELVADVERLMPLVMLPGMTTMICPVRIGNLTGGWQPDSLDPRNLHRPIAFTLLHHIQMEAAAGRLRLTSAGTMREQAAREHVELRSRLFGGFFHRSRLADLRATMEQADRVLEDERARLAVQEEQIDRLFTLLGNMPILQDGVVTNLDKGDGVDE